MSASVAVSVRHTRLVSLQNEHGDLLAHARRAGEQDVQSFTASHGPRYGFNGVYVYLVTTDSLWRSPLALALPGEAPAAIRWPLSECAIDVHGRHPVLFTPDGPVSLTLASEAETLAVADLLPQDGEQVAADPPASGRGYWNAMTATGTVWDPDEPFVRWLPRTRDDGSLLMDVTALRVGHPGLVHDSSWQDVGVTWIGLEDHLVTTGSFFDTEDLEQVSAVAFAKAVLEAAAAGQPHEAPGQE